MGMVFRFMEAYFWFWHKASLQTWWVVGLLVVIALPYTALVIDQGKWLEIIAVWVVVGLTVATRVSYIRSPAQCTLCRRELVECRETTRAAYKEAGTNPPIFPRCTNRP